MKEVLRRAIDASHAFRSPILHRNPKEITFTYDPDTKQLVKVTHRDKVTGKVRVRHIEYDPATGLPKRIYEE